MKMMEKNLTNKISNILPGGRVEVTRLPQCPEISLYLLNSDYLGTLLDKERGAQLIDAPMFWLFCWASGHALARYIMDNPHWVQDRHILDFGCGSGIAAIAAAKAGATKIWACDSDPVAAQAAELNCQLNSVPVEVISDWKDCTTELDLILAADVLYDSANLDLLHEFAARASGVLVADSRVKDFHVPFYRKIAEMQSTTVPDFGEGAEYGQVNFYFANHRMTNAATP